MYASASTTSAVLTKRFNQTTGGTVDYESGDFNSLINITDITSTATINIVIKRFPGSITTVIYGAEKTIAEI